MLNLFFDNLTALCQAQGITPTALLKRLNKSTSKLTAWKEGKLPKVELATELAEQLGVNANQLFGEDIASNSQFRISQLKKKIPLSDEEVVLIPNDFYKEEISADGIPILNAIKKNQQTYCWCKYCLTWHHHGEVPGPAVAHCTNKNSPYKDGGYDVKIALDLDVPIEVTARGKKITLTREELRVIDMYRLLSQPQKESIEAVMREYLKTEGRMHEGQVG